MALLPALLGLLGGAAKNKAQKKANKQNVNAQLKINAHNLKHQTAINAQNIRMQDVINRRNLKAQAKANADNIALQRETNAQNQANYETSRKDAKSVIQSTVADAQAAGINPLTAIRGGATHSGPQAPVLMSPHTEAAMQYAARADASRSVAPQVNPVVGMAEAIQDAGVTVYNAMVAQPDPEREALEKALLAEELREMQERNQPVFEKSFGYAIPNVVNTSGVDHGNGSQDNVTGNPRTDTIRVHGRDFDTSLTFDDAEVIEQRYGDVVSWGYGLQVLGADIGKALKQEWANMTRTRPVPRPIFSSQIPLRTNYGFHNFGRRAPGF